MSVIDRFPTFSFIEVFSQMPVSQEASLNFFPIHFHIIPKSQFQFHFQLGNLIRPGHLYNCKKKKVFFEGFLPLSSLCGLTSSPSGVAWHKNNYLNSLSLKEEEVALDFSGQDVSQVFQSAIGRHMSD